MSTLNEYQLEAGRTNKGTALYTVETRGAVPTIIPGLYNALGMAGETGEVAEKIKKLARDGSPQNYHEWRNGFGKELGDVLWYLSQLARDFGFSLQEVADMNLAKLRDRAARGVLSGSGDAR